MGKYKVVTDQGTFMVTTDDEPSAPGVPNPLQANPTHYTPSGLQPEHPAGFLANLAHSLINYTSPGPSGGPDLMSEMAQHPGENPLQPWPAFRNTLSDLGHLLTNPSEDPIAAANLIGAPIQALTHPMSRAAGSGAAAAVRSDLPAIKSWGKAGAGIGALMGHGGLDTLLEGGGVGGAIGSGVRAIPPILHGAYQGASDWLNPSPSIPGLEGEYVPPKLKLPFTRGSETPELGVSGSNRGTGRKLQPEPIEPVESTQFKPSPGVKSKIRFTPGSETPDLGVSGRNPAQSWTPPSESLIPDLNVSDLPDPGARFKPSASVKRKMSGARGSEVPEIGVHGTNRGTGRRIQPIGSENPAVDITTGQELVPAPGSAPIPHVTAPGGSPVPAKSASFRHPADFTDLIRQFHATHPKGTSLRDLSAKVYGTKPGTMPSYDQALALHEWMLRNPGKTPAPGLK